jgi:hypothetical protein
MEIKYYAQNPRKTLPRIGEALDNPKTKTNLYNDGRSRVSSGSTVSDYGLDDRAIGVRFPAGGKGFFL